MGTVGMVGDSRMGRDVGDSVGGGDSVVGTVTGALVVVGARVGGGVGLDTGV